jgi:hypothetical protein
LAEWLGLVLVAGDSHRRHASACVLGLGLALGVKALR